MHMHGNIEYWQLQDAKARLSELVKSAKTEGPQGISVRGQPEVIVISVDEYEALTKAKINFFDFMQSSPLRGIDLNIARDQSTDRDVDL
jgi:antitoxin Phd